MRTRPVTASDGVTRFYVDQLANPETIEVQMGGRFREGVLIGGRVATVSEAMESQVLYRRFRSALRRHFTRVRAFLVGPSAHRRLLSGWRLTTAAHSPMEFDLAPDSDPS
ncbi:MAG: hypothetical protein HUU15_04400 [Candidatus Brocadiae bacterium]|nr:hypothetical protein [Candidatus Brocadiia bacterium]